MIRASVHGTRAAASLVLGLVLVEYMPAWVALGAAALVTVLAVSTAYLSAAPATLPAASRDRPEEPGRKPGWIDESN